MDRVYRESYREHHLIPDEVSRDEILSTNTKHGIGKAR